MRRIGVLASVTAAFLSFTAALISFDAAQPSKAQAEAPGPAIHQLRVYEIFDANKRAFHQRFRDHAARIMAKYDFRILAMWEAKSGERTEFVYLLEWPDEQTMKDRWARFMADTEWAEIKRQTSQAHGRMVGKIEDRTLRLTPYSRGELMALTRR